MTAVASLTSIPDRVAGPDLKAVAEPVIEPDVAPEPDADLISRSQLSVWTDQRLDSCHLTLHGELTSHSISTLERHIDLLGACRCDEVVIDLTGITNIDATGARVLIGLEFYVCGRGGRCSFVGFSASVASALAVARSTMTPPPPLALSADPSQPGISPGPGRPVARIGRPPSASAPPTGPVRIVRSGARVASGVHERARRGQEFAGLEPRLQA